MGQKTLLYIYGRFKGSFFSQVYNNDIMSIFPPAFPRADYQYCAPSGRIHA